MKTEQNTFELTSEPVSEWSFGHSYRQAREIHVPNLRLLLLAFGHDSPGALKIEGHLCNRWYNWLCTFDLDHLEAWQQELSDILADQAMDKYWMRLGFELLPYLTSAANLVDNWTDYYADYGYNEPEGKSQALQMQLHRRQYDMFIPMTLVSAILDLPELDKSWVD